MLLTEREARKLLCPNIHDSEGAAGDCIASGCMAWRWYDELRRRFVADPIPDAKEDKGLRPKHVPVTWPWMPSEDGEPAGWLEPESDAQAHMRGYCGLAGQPGEVQRGIFETITRAMRQMTEGIYSAGSVRGMQ